MVNNNDLSKKEQEKYNNFNNFYIEPAVDMFNKIFSNAKEDTKKMDFYEPYLNIIKKTSDLIKESNVSGPLQSSVLFEYLLWNGYLSKDNNLVFSTSDRILNLGLPGADIVRGKSVCLNNAMMLNEVLRESGFESYILGCNVDTSLPKINLEYRPNIERNVDEKTGLKYKVLSSIAKVTPIKHVGNHAFTLINYDGKYVICDPTNLTFLENNGLFKANFVGADTEVVIKPWVIFHNKIKHEDFHKLFNKLLEQSDESVLSLEKVRNFSEYVMEVCEESKPLFKDFHEDIKEDINIVANTLVKTPRK